MANPFHDETGRFCSKGEMGEAVERVYQTMVSTPSGPAQEEAANAWFNLRNEFDAAKKEEQRPDILKLGLQNAPTSGRRADLDKLAEAQASLPDRTADSFARYTLPKGAMGFGSQEERYAQVATTTAIHVLIDKAQQSPYVTSHASAKNVNDALAKALGTFKEESGQAALQLSLKRTQAILDKHTRDHALATGGLQARIDVIPAIRDLELKALTTDIDDPKGEAQDYGAPVAVDRSYGKDWAEKAAETFEERTADLDLYEVPPGVGDVSSLATAREQRKAQDVTLDAVDSLINLRSLVNQDYADYRLVSKRLKSHFSVLGDANDSTRVSLDRVDAILRNESSQQELSPGRTGVYVDVKAALRALEAKAFTDDLHSPLPTAGADHARAERDAQQREATRSVREGRRAVPSESDEMKRLFTENPDEFYRRNRANAAAKAEGEGKRRPPRFIARSEGRKPDVNGPRF